MSGTFSVSGSNLIVSFEYIGASQKVADTATYAAKNLYRQNAIEQSEDGFDSLSNQQKLDIVDRHVKKNIVSLARQQYIIEIGQIARQEARLELATKFIGES